MPAGGYFGRALVVDVTSGTSRRQPLPDGVLRGYIGGSGLGTWLLYLTGLTAADTDRHLRGELGRGWRVAAIGPAGERGVRAPVRPL